MTKEQLKKELEDIKSKIEYQKLCKEELINNYIIEHREFDDGEKVYVITPEKIDNFTKKIYPESKRIAFIYFVYINKYRFTLEYICKKSKKDGTPSLRNDYIWESEIIKKI